MIGVSESLDEVTHQGEMEIGLEGQTDGMVELLEIPLQGLASPEHGRSDVILVERALLLQGDEILFEQRHA